MRKRTYWIFYVAVCILVLGLKCFSGSAGSDELLWLLAPAVRWVKLLSGITFVYEPGVGYISHAVRFIIAPSCSGICFLMICIMTLVFSFVRRMRTWRGAFAWTVCSLGASWLFTVLVNGVRIVLSIRIPQALEGVLAGGLLTSERLHTVIGTSVYFMSLLLLWQLGESISGKISGTAVTDPVKDCLQPVFWYLAMVLGIPFLGRVLRNDYEGFGRYAAALTAVCAVIFGLFQLARRLLQRR